MMRMPLSRIPLIFSVNRSVMVLAGVIIVTALPFAGCDRQDKPVTPAAAPGTSAAPSLWQVQDRATIVAVPVHADQPADIELATALTAATQEARQTAETARQRWQAASETDRPNWSIKWAAPLARGESAKQKAQSPASDVRGLEPAEAVEQVWVQPVTWSAFRIEGVLASKPVSELACGKAFGELVSFPIDELTDWLHILPTPAAGSDIAPGPNATQPAIAQAREGGYTIKALESRYGKP